MRIANLGIRWCASLAVLVGATALAACGGSEQGAAPPTGETTLNDAATTETAATGDREPLVLGISLTDLTPYHVAMVDDINATLTEVGGQALEPAVNNFDAGKQVSDIRNLITAGANALFVTTADSRALAPAISDANDKGIPVVAVDEPIETGGIFITVRANNIAMAEQACQEMGQRMNGEGTVLSLQGDLATGTGRDRTDGFAACMAKNFPDITVVGRPTEWDTTKAANIMQTILTTNADLAGVYMQSDTLFLAPVLAALERAGRTATVGEPGHVVVVGIDGTPQTLQAIRDGAVDATVSQPIGEYASLGVEYADMALAGDTPALGPTDHGSEIVEDGQNGLTDFLEAPLVTQENVDDESLWGNTVSGDG